MEKKTETEKVMIDLEKLRDLMQKDLPFDAENELAGGRDYCIAPNGTKFYCGIGRSVW
jgi:hypothetical protein